MTLKDFIEPIQTLAPMVATALGGPLAGMAVRTLSTAVLGTPDGSEEQIAKAISTADPAVYQKLKEAEQEFLVTMEKLGVEREKLNTADRADARKREIALKDKTPAILAAVCFVGFFGILIGLVFFTIPKSSAAPLNIMLGALGGMVASIVAYYFGSSKGSAEKNSTISQFVKGR